MMLISMPRIALIGSRVLPVNAALLVRGVSNKSVLLDTDLLTVQVAGDYRAHQGRMALFIYNKADYDLTRFVVNIDNVDGLGMKRQDPPMLVSPGKHTLPCC